MCKGHGYVTCRFVVLEDAGGVTIQQGSCFRRPPPLHVVGGRQRDELNRAGQPTWWLVRWSGLVRVYQVQVNNNERFLNNSRGGFGRRHR